MRKHIAQALRTRSKTIQKAIESYNAAASAMSPPRQTISWEQVVDYSYLSEFDILRDTREDVRERKWATQKNRLLMQEFFKLIRAENELPRLHIEIQRLITYMAREEVRLLGFVSMIQHDDPALAYQISVHWFERARFNDIHRKRLLSIKRLEGFDSRNNKYFSVGVPVRKEAPMEMAEDIPSGLNEDDEGESDVEEEDDENELLDEIDLSLSVAMDS